MNLEWMPCPLRGTVTVPPSKSQTIRLLLCAALAEGESSLSPVLHSADVEAALSCITALGAVWREPEPGLILVRGRGNRKDTSRPHYDCGESATVLRLMIPLSLALTGGGSFRGQGRLLERPLQPYVDLCEKQGIRWEQDDKELRIFGRLSPGDYSLPGDQSSQFFSGLLFALPLLEGGSSLTALTPPESADYIRMTQSCLRRSGILIYEEGYSFRVAPQRYQPIDAIMEGDWSQGAFWLAASALGNPVRVEGLPAVTDQADRRAKDYFAALSRQGDLSLDVSQCPDLLPPLAAAASVRQGCCRFTGAGRLRYKESDRLCAVADTLRTLGADVKEYPNALEIRGKEYLSGGVSLDCRGDHRIAMMAAIAATRCRGGSVRFLGADCVCKSYPDFWEQLKKLGGDCHVLSMGK